MDIMKQMLVKQLLKHVLQVLQEILQESVLILLINLMVHGKMKIQVVVYINVLKIIIGHKHQLILLQNKFVIVVLQEIRQENVIQMVFGKMKIQVVL